MGAFYGSTQVRQQEYEAVVQAAETVARDQGCKCLIGPVLNDWIGIYPENHGQDDNFGAAIAQKLGGFVLHLLLHDSDVMAYWLWRDGELVDAYWSRPSYFGGADHAKQERMAGRPQEFRPVIGEKADKLAAILRRDQTAFALEDERLERFARLLRISNASTAYEYLKEGDATGRKGWRRFVEVPRDAASAETKSRRTERSLANTDRRRLEQDGLILLRDERKETASRGCVVGTGYVVAWSSFRTSGSIEDYREPWRGPTPSGLDFSEPLVALASDAAGRRLAIADGNRIRIWDVSDDGRKAVADLPVAHLEGGPALSADGTTAAYATRDQFIVTDIARQQPLLRMTARNISKIAFHPLGDWIVAAGSTLALISLSREPHWRDLFVGGQAPTKSVLGEWFRSQIRKVDVESLPRQQQAGIDAAATRIQQALNRSKKAGGAAQKMEIMRRLQEMRPQMEKEQQDLMSRWTAIKEGREPPAPPRAKEEVICVGFSRDGQWLWCGTNVGLRVFRWESMPLEPGTAMPEPTWQYVYPGPLLYEFQQSVSAIAEEADAEAIVFGGGNGRLYRCDLKSGAVRELAKLPGLAGVRGLAMSSDGATLGVSSSWTPQMPAGPKDLRHTWDIWSYPRVRRLLIHSE
jgi:hypothetical protein